MSTRSMTGLTALCATRPSADVVIAVLAPLGLSLVFEMKADDEQTYLHLAPLPAQFHYRDQHGTEVLYLAGVDREEAQPVPRHASRFWLYAGADADICERVAQVLAATWALTWRETGTPTLEAVA